MTGQSAPRRAVFLTHPIFSAPGFGSHHPLSIPRHGAVVALMRSLGWLDACETVACPLPPVETLARFHDPDYLAALEAAARTGQASSAVRARYNLGTMECPLFPGLWDRARATVGGAIAAARLALSGHLPFHPAGGTHHGRRDRASGFCYFNDPVFAIMTLLDAARARVLYVDLDAHHGDGVEAAFEHDPRVMTISIHEAGRWPGSGRLDQRGAIGQARNMPVPRGFNDSELGHLMAAAVLPLAERFCPDAVVVTCGVDALAGDPLSGLALSNAALCDAVVTLVDAVPCAVVLGGGGYNPWTLARAWTGLWGRLSRRDVAIPLPAAGRAVLAGLDCDLVDSDDRDPAWLEQLWDARREGPVREEVRATAIAVMR
jgi:acetoin utilization protein AcuC